MGGHGRGAGEGIPVDGTRVEGKTVTGARVGGKTNIGARVGGKTIVGATIGDVMGGTVTGERLGGAVVVFAVGGAVVGSGVVGPIIGTGVGDVDKDSVAAVCGRLTSTTSTTTVPRRPHANKIHPKENHRYKGRWYHFNMT